MFADSRPLDFPQPDFNTEAYDRIVDNRFLEVSENPLSTFSIDVDTASYSNVRRFLRQEMRPPKDAVRIEEMLNYFSYDYPAPSGKDPFSVHVEVAQAPWNLEHRLVRVGLKGKEIQLEKRPSSNLVFLLDVSGSMRPSNKLPLLKKGMRLLVEKLGENDQVAIVVYAGASGLVLPSTSCEQKEKIMAALENLEAGGSTNGGSGIQLAYETAVSNLIPGGINRVILATDGDFNVGITNQGDLTRLIEERAKSGVFLSVLGFGMGNYKDSTLEKLADKGNGNYAYIDTINEARKVLVDQIDSTLITIAKDVKIQIEFNPVQVQAYRLIGYENRLLRKEDFNDDTKDAGEIGAGHTVTALYEIVPAGKKIQIPGVDPLKYQKPIETTDVAQEGELLMLKLRYKEPDGQTSKLLEFPVRDSHRAYSQASQDFKFAAAVASFGMILRESPHKGNATLDSVLELAEEGKGSDPHGYRGQFLELVKRAKALAGSDSSPNR
ncbi:VWA domain-containing protein [Acidobacteria bacterium AH-259-L09]|nr:VWA domain-containing protein [Acidobacteria bacterium AH-259-L09]